MDVLKNVVIVALPIYIFFMIVICWGDALKISDGKYPPSHPFFYFLTVVMAVLVAICI